MPTFVTITVKPSGGDYTSLNTALANVASNLTVSDEQVTIECDTFPGGLAEQVVVPSITQDATRYLVIKGATGHEYNPVDGSGFFLTANIGFSGVFVNSQNFTRLHGIGVKNTRTLGSGRGVQWNGNDCVISNVYASTTSSSGAACFWLTNANNLDISDCLSYLGTTGFDFGNNNTRTANKLTSIDASSVGFDTGTADTTLTNSLTIGSSNPYLGTFNAASSNNAGDSTDTPGTSPFNNRTTADLANYALGDFRTASSSTLATGGTVDFIGYDIEPTAGGVTGDVDFSISKPVFTANGTATLPAPSGDIAFTIDNPVLSASGSATLPQPDGDIDFTISKPVFNSTGGATLPQPSGDVSFTVSKPLFSASGSATVPYPQGDIEFTVGKPVFSATGAATQPNPSGNISFTVNKPVFSATGEATLPNPAGAANFAIDKPVFTASGSASLPYPQGNVDFTVNKPQFSASGSVTLPSPSGDVDFTISKPIFAATGTVSGLEIPLGIVLTPTFGSNVIKLPTTSNTIKL